MLLMAIDVMLWYTYQKFQVLWYICFRDPLALNYKLDVPDIVYISGLVVTWNSYKLLKRKLIKIGMKFLHLLRRFASTYFQGMVA